ncbi:HSF1 family protein [Megaselia abdita]
MHTFSETGGGSVPAFLAKLWRLVEDKETNQLIHWTKDGKSFVIQNQAQFARELLPLNYKHNNMASFIRQLNMYGFHKISSIDNGGLKFDRDEMEFSHPCFKKDSPYLLEHIKRKIANPKAVEEKTGEPAIAVNKVLHEVKSMRGAQETFDSRLSVIKQENEALWREIASLRQKHMKQQQIVNKLIQFLVTLVQPTSRNMSGVKRQFQLMINDAPHSSGKPRRNSDSSDNNGPVIHELTEELLEATDDPDLLTCTPNVDSPGGGSYINSPGGGSSFRIENVEDRPASSASYNSNYDDVNSMDEEAIQLIEQQPTYQQVKQELSNQYVGQKQFFDTENQANQAKRSRRRKAPPQEAGTSKVAKIVNGSQNKQPVLIKTENDIDQLLMMQSPNTNPNSAGNEYITSSFLSNDVPNDIFEEQSQVQPTQVGGIDLASGSYNDKIDLNGGLAKASSSGVNKNPVLGSDISSALQLAPVNNSNGKFLRLNSREDINSHLDGVQENLDSLKDILMGEGYSLDPNTLLGLFNDSEILNPYMTLTPSDIESGANPKELTYEPFCGDLSDMLNTDSLNYKTSDDKNEASRGEASVLNTPYHE